MPVYPWYDSECAVYTGVSLRTLLEEAGVKSNGNGCWLKAVDAAAKDRSLPIEKALLDDCIIAYKMNGEALYPEQGYPMAGRVIGRQLGVKYCAGSRWATNPGIPEKKPKYTDLLPNGKARRFTWAMDAKSVINSPELRKRRSSMAKASPSSRVWLGAATARSWARGCLARTADAPQACAARWACS